jgi:hypothetical protein
MLNSDYTLLSRYALVSAGVNGMRNERPIGEAVWLVIRMSVWKKSV